MKSIYLLYICSLLVLLSGCAGLARTVHNTGSLLPGQWGQGVKYASFGIAEIERQEQRRQQEAEKQRRIEEYNRKLAAMSPKEREEFLRKAREQAELQQKEGAKLLWSILGAAMSGSSQSNNSHDEYYYENK
jgi:TolA-binding protein